MDTQRNLQILKEVEFKYNQDLKTNDPNNRLQVKGAYKTNAQVCVVRFDSEDINLAIGSSDGIATIIQTAKQTEINEKSPTDQLITGQPGSLRFPTTALRWRSGDYSTKNKFILISANSDGTITHWNTRTSQIISRIKEEEDNEVYAIDLNFQETFLATAGKDNKVRVYDEETQQHIQTLSSVIWTAPGHNNRVFSVKFDPKDPHILLSGGWDCNIMIWDVRAKVNVGSILGPKISGDAIDIQGQQILTGSHRMNEQLQLWDLGTRKMIQDIRWDADIVSTGAFVFGCQFSKSKAGLILGGSSGSNEVRVFNSKDGLFQNEASLYGFTQGIYTIDFANHSNRFTLAGANGITLVCSITQDVVVN